jgi:putative salt-induced outer membrane protein YdiY
MLNLVIPKEQCMRRSLRKRPYGSAAANGLAGAVLASAFCLSLAQDASAQLVIKEDDQWRYSIGLGASIASGNSSSKSLNATADAVKANVRNKWTLYGRLLRAKDDEETTSDQITAGVRYDRELTRPWFQFVLVDWLRDRPANIAQRWSGNTGLGYHIFKEEKSFWDAFAGVGYANDHFVEDTVVAGDLRSNYGRPELLVGEQSQHQLSDNTTFKQRLSIFPNLDDRGEYRAVFDTTLAVAINRTFALTASLNYRYNSDPGTGLDKKDLLFVTGILVRME